MATFYELRLMIRVTKLHGTETNYCSSATLEPSIHLGYSSWRDLQVLPQYLGFFFLACRDRKFSP